jgi:hypothetical protein
MSVSSQPAAAMNHEIDLAPRNAEIAEHMVIERAEAAPGSRMSEMIVNTAG